MGQRIVVLGGHGFLGQHVVRLARQAGDDATALSRRDGVDVTRLESLVPRLGEIQPAAVINCAAHVGSLHYVSRFAADVVHDNMQIILNLYRAVQQACPAALVVNPVSNCSYPGAAVVQKEAEWLDGPVHDSVLAYGNPRRMIQVVAECYCKQYGTRSINWLVANAYGPGDALDPDKVHAMNGIVIRLIQAQRGGRREFEIWGTGRPVREWCYIEDAARILVASLQQEGTQTYPVNLGQNKGYSIAEIAELAARELGYDVRFTFNTKFPDGAPTKVLDDARFRQLHPHFAFTPIAEGLRRTIEYYQAELP